MTSVIKTVTIILGDEISNLSGLFFYEVIIMWITEDDVNFETAKLKIGEHYVPVLVAHINKSLNVNSTLGVEADHLEAFSKKYFDALGPYDEMDSYGIPPLYYAGGFKECTTHPLMSVTYDEDSHTYHREFLTGYTFPYKCDETTFCKNALTNNDVKYWAGASIYESEDIGGFGYCTICSRDVADFDSVNNDYQDYIEYDGAFSGLPIDTEGVYTSVQINNATFLMLYSDVDNQFYSYHYTYAGGQLGRRAYDITLPIEPIRVGPETFDVYQSFFDHNGTRNSETIYIDFPVKDIVVKNYTPGQPDEPSGDDNKGTNPNDHMSLPDGDYNYNGDKITDDGAPDDNPNSMGIMGLWSPSRAQYKAFCHYLWNGFQQAMVGAFGNNDGMECVLACKEYPFVINATKEATMALGSVDTNLTVNVAPGNYFAIVYKGTVKHPSNSFMDYSPYSKLSVYLPHIGITDLDIDQVSGREVVITYKIDIVSGMGIVLISTVDDNKNNIVIGSYPVQMGKELPVTATDYQRLAQSWAGLAMTAVGASVGVGLPLMEGVMPLVGTAITAKNSGATFGMATGAGGAVAGSAGQAANASKADIKQSGSLGGSSGMLGISYPYFIYKMTNFSNSGYKDLIGKKSSVVVKLSTLKGSGFNKIDAVNLHIEGATDEELAEIKQDLLSGVIL